MAKSSKIAVSSDRLRSLCTAAERRLLDASERLSKIAHADAQILLKQVRETRDKWRDLLGKQSRAVKRSPKEVSEANVRSESKADLFHAAVQRIESHLKSLGSAVASVAKSVLKSPAARKPGLKRARVAGHRTARAGLRAELAGKAATLNRAIAKPAAKPVASKPVVLTSKPAAAVGSPGAVKTVGTSKATSKKRMQPPAKALAAAQAIRFDAAKQRTARTAAKNSRLKVEGLATRRASHTIAAGKRSQARRDKRR